jgi:hypothetical protein
MKELAKAIATCGIWLATAVIFTFGLFRMNGSTEFFVLSTIAIASAAAVATVVVWLPRGLLETAADKPPPRPEELPETDAPTTIMNADYGITRKPD